MAPVRGSVPLLLYMSSRLSTFRKRARLAILLGALFLLLGTRLFATELSHFSSGDKTSTVNGASPPPDETKSAVVIDEATLPTIKTLTNKDENFRLLTHTIEENDKAYYKIQRSKRLRRQNASDVPLEDKFFLYTCTKDDTLLSVAAATCLPYDTIATLNDISNMNTSLLGRTIILGTQKGVYIKNSPKSALEVLLYKEYFESGYLDNSDNSIKDNATETIKGRDYTFVALLRFTPTQRAFFMDRAFRLPLDTKVVSSEFGGRISPVYHRWKVHKGIDFAAPVGDWVYACKSGVVAYVFLNDKTFGNYIILSHENKMTSVYAHLSAVLVEEGQRVDSGTIIGKVGATGMVTGPHLHFELRENGDARNPRELLPL